jgi:glycosyltransferase involved in cell wall biosynthesis
MISIIIPAHNEEKYIGKCLTSIKNIKSSESFEVIVVNNTSTDRTKEVVEKLLPEAKIIDEPRKGLTLAYNRGAKEAKGDILAFVDADMILPPNHLERISKEFTKDSELVLLSGPYRYKDGGFFCDLVTRLSYLLIAMPAELILVRFLNIGASMASGNSAVRKWAFEKVGGFNERLFYGLETEFALRAKKLGKVRFKYYLTVESSARRLKKEGALRTVARHILNIIGPWIFKKPFTKTYIDIR